MKKLAIIACLLSAIAACRTPRVEILAGKYDDGQGSIILADKRTLVVDIQAANHRDGIACSGNYPYYVSDDGEIRLVFQRSIDALHGLGTMKFHWDGRDIIMVNPEINKTNIFTRAPAKPIEQ